MVSTKYSTDACVTDVACGDDHTVALLDDGNVVAFGRGDAGQLGRARPTAFVGAPGPVHELKGATAVAAKAACTCGFVANEALFVEKCSRVEAQLREALERKVAARRPSVCGY